MFTPDVAQVREFFCTAYSKSVQGQALAPLEAMAADWISQHPEYHAVLESQEAAKDLQAVEGQGNPFLHLAMHLSISEQCSIDQPPGIREGTQALAVRLGSLHEAHHDVMECLGRILWESQRNGVAPDGAAYVECVQRRARR